MRAASIAPWLVRRGIHYGWVMMVLTFLSGWIFASHQVGGAIAGFMSAASHGAFLTYLPAYIAAGFACLIAATAIFALRDARLAAARAG